MFVNKNPSRCQLRDIPRTYTVFTTENARNLTEKDQEDRNIPGDSVVDFCVVLSVKI